MKKLISALAALVLGASLLTVPAFAASGDVQTYAALCLECNIGEVFLTEYDTPKVIIGSSFCTKDPKAVDITYQWNHYKTWRCNYCGAGETTFTVETVTPCDH